MDRIPQWTEMGMLAVRAVLRGEASPDQQRVAMQYIAEEFCRRFDSPYMPGAGELDTGVEMGRHLVGVWISNCNDMSFIDRMKAEQAAAQQREAVVARATRRGKANG